MGQSGDSQGGQEGRKGSSSGRHCLSRVYAGLISSLMSEGVHLVMFLLVEDFFCLFFVDLLSISFAFTRLALQRGPPSATQMLTRFSFVLVYALVTISFSVVSSAIAI